ncbi:ICAM2 protein, partial [Odontophorus gujanensis]|nr:ICAM2 protein [Odontophorus gujanensis]
LFNVTVWNSTMRCYYSCFGTKKSAVVELLVYRPLEQAELDAIPLLEAGHSHNLSCRVPNVSPVRNLTVTLRRGDSTLHTATFTGHSQQQPEDVLVTHAVTARREDHG